MKNVLIIGLEPTLIDFSAPEYNLVADVSASRVLTEIKAGEEHLKNLGYNAESCLIDFGETAEAVVLED